MKLRFISIIVFFILVATHTPQSYAYPWNINSIDTMKLSRDSARNPQIDIGFWVKKVASLHANYIAIDTPYDNEFTLVLTKWVQEARKNHLHVWFRGNFSGWEGWFGYPPITIQQHYQKTSEFITSHPDLFAEGDIFTPAPEPENGIIGDPRSSPEVAKEYKTFLVTSYDTCVKAFAMINKHVSCGYFSVNGDIALNILDQSTINSLGKVIVIDHYVPSTRAMTDEIEALNKKFHASIIIGEFGAPIDDITGPMDDTQQAAFVTSILDVVNRHASVIGFNYWVIEGGSTALVQEDGSNKPAASAIMNFYNPVTVTALVKDFKNKPAINKKIESTQGNVLTDKYGKFTISFPRGQDIHLIIKGDLKPVSVFLQHVTQNMTLKTFTLQPNHYTITDILHIWWEKLRTIFSQK